MNRVRRNILCLGLLVAVLIGKAEKKPNVLFIISDDLTTTAVSSFGAPVCQTPNIDRLANEGVSFLQSYCQYPVCGPSRASMLFGYYPSATQMYNYKSGRANVGPNKMSLPQLFKENGYYTARVSKLFHMGIPIDIEKGSDGADDEDSWTERFNVKALEWQTPGEAELVQGNPDGSIERKGGNVMTIVKGSENKLEYADGQAAQKACELLREHKDKPFFLAVGLVRPHVPFVAPKSYYDPYPFQGITPPAMPENDWDDIPKRGINYVTSVNGKMSYEQEQKAIAAYYASVSFMDEQVGVILNTLKEEGLDENTIVVFTSDHGFHLGEHKFWMKVSLKEESVRVPMIIKAPGVKPSASRSFTELIDLYPTISELADLSLQNEVQGESLVSIMANPSRTVRDEVLVCSLGGGALMIRNEKWCYIEYGKDGIDGMELFDMKMDPEQFDNLANNKKYCKQVKRMKTLLNKKLSKVRDNDLGIEYLSNK